MEGSASNYRSLVQEIVGNGPDIDRTAPQGALSLNAQTLTPMTSDPSPQSPAFPFQRMRFE